MLNFIIGLPCAGKTTYLKNIPSRDCLKYEVGDIYRRHIRDDDEIGKLVKPYAERNEIFPDDITNKMINDIIKSLEKTSYNVVISGYPRTLTQLKNIFEKYSKDDYHFIILKETYEVLKERANKRNRVNEDFDKRYNEEKENLDEIIKLIEMRNNE